MSFSNLKEIFDHYCETEINRKLLESLTKWRNRFYSRNSEHVGFFSTASFGLYIPKWMSSDDDVWLNEILGIDEDEVADFVYALPTINKDFKVSSNILSIGMVYLMHRAHTSKTLSQKERDGLKLVIMEIMVARYLTSVMNNYFCRGKTSPEISTEVYERLTRRFDLKVAGNWKNWIEMKSELFVIGDDQRADAKYAKQEVFDTFDDELVVRKLNSVKSQINKSIAEINAVFRQVLDDQEKVISTSALSMSVDGLYLGDLVRQQSQFLHYQDKIFTDENSFIKEDLLYVIESSMPTLVKSTFRETLSFMVRNQLTPKWKNKILDARHDVMIYSLALIQSEGLKTNDLVQIAHRLRQNLLSGKANDKTLLSVRKLVDGFIYEVKPKLKGKLVSLERSAVMLYIILRTLAMNYYKS